MVFSEYMVILLLIVVYQTLGNEKAKAMLEVQKTTTQKKVDILHHIYGMLPLIVIKANTSTKVVKELNDSARKIFGEKEDHKRIVLDSIG